MEIKSLLQKVLKSQEIIMKRMITSQQERLRKQKLATKTQNVVFDSLNSMKYVRSQQLLFEKNLQNQLKKERPPYSFQSKSDEILHSLMGSQKMQRLIKSRKQRFKQDLYPENDKYNGFHNQLHASFCKRDFQIVKPHPKAQRLRLKNQKKKSFLSLIDYE